MKVVLLSMDSFYTPLTPEQRKAAEQGLHNFDHPCKLNLIISFIESCCFLASVDFELLRQVLTSLKKGYLPPPVSFDIVPTILILLIL